VTLLDAESAVVPIESLFPADAGPHIVKRGTATARPATLGRLELVSHGEHLRQAADSLERAPSATQRELRAHTMLGTFRTLSEASGGALADAVSRFAHQARDAVAGGHATRDAAGFAALLRRAGEILSGSASGDEAALAKQLDIVTGSLAGGGGGGVAAETEEPPVAETADLVGSWATYQRLVAGGVGAASLAEFLGSNGSAPAPARATPTRAAAAAEPAVVDIRSLLFRGDRALARARELRTQAARSSPEQLKEILEEVCDLVALALEPGV
jgi:hypothetical protein